MMNSFSMFNKIKKASVNNCITFKCPYCNHENDINNMFCNECNSNIERYTSLYGSYIVYFNNAVNQFKNGNYILSFVNIVKFLEYDKKNQNALRLYICLLKKLNFTDLYEEELEKYEDQFVRDPWIMEIETRGIDNYIVPDTIEIEFEVLENSFNSLKNEFNKTITSNKSNLIEFIKRFYDLVNALRDTVFHDKIMNFYSMSFLPFIEKFNIVLKSSDGLNYYSLSDKELMNLEIICTTESTIYDVGTIITLQPLIKINNLILSKEKAMYVDKKIIEDPLPKKNVKITKRVYGKNERYSKYIKDKKLKKIRAYRY